MVFTFKLLNLCSVPPLPQGESLPKVFKRDYKACKMKDYFLPLKVSAKILFMLRLTGDKVFSLTSQAIANFYDTFKFLRKEGIELTQPLKEKFPNLGNSNRKNLLNIKNPKFGMPLI